MRERVHMEPGPASDLMLSLFEQDLSKHFFYNTKYLIQYHKAGKEKKKSVPGYNHFKKVETFMEEHGEKGELFYEKRVGNYTKDRSVPCEYCQFFNRSVPKSPRPYPDYSVLPRYKYISLINTPRDDRTTDDFVPRVRLKEAWKKEEIASNENDQIQHFAETYIVDKEYVVAYLQHLEMLELKKKKRAE